MRYDKDRFLSRILIWFIIGLIATALLAQPLFMVVLYLLSIYYITFPSFILLLIVLRIISQRRDYMRLFRSIDNETKQKEFKQETGQTIFKNGKKSRAYISWVMKDVPKSVYKNEENSYNDVLAIAIGVSIIVLLALMLLSFTSGMPLI